MFYVGPENLRIVRGGVVSFVATLVRIVVVLPVAVVVPVGVGHRTPAPGVRSALFFPASRADLVSCKKTSMSFNLTWTFQLWPLVQCQYTFQNKTSLYYPL